MVGLLVPAMQDAKPPALVPTSGLDNRAHYDALVAEHGRSFRACGWGSRASQHARFAVFTEEVPLDGSVLDVGCGLGDLYGYLRDSGRVPAAYRGIDLSPSMVDSARGAFPGVDFAVEDLLATRPERCYDHVVASGIFTYIGESNVELFHQLIEAMYARCARALVFNSLSTWATDEAHGEFRADPVDTLRFVASLSSRLRLRTDYHPRDFTVVVHRPPQLEPAR